MYTRTRYLTVITVVALVAAACGGGGTNDTTTTAPQAAETTTTTAAATTTTEATATTATEAPPTTEATTTTTTTTEAPPITVPIDELPWLFDDLGADDRATLAAGEYRSDALSHQLRHVTTDEVTVWKPGVIYGFGLPGFDVGTDGSVFFMDVGGLPPAAAVGIHDHDPEADRQMPIHDTVDLDAFFENTPGVVLLDSGTDSDDVTLDTWWEFTTDDTAPESFDDCNFGDHCYNIVFVDGCDCYFIAGDEWTYRLWRLGHGHGAVYAWFQAPNDIYADSIGFGEQIVAGVTVIE